jgi:hypothetical protein
METRVLEGIIHHQPETCVEKTPARTERKVRNRIVAVSAFVNVLIGILFLKNPGEAMEKPS